MGKWNIEICYGFNVTVSGIEAGSRNEAISKAKDAAESVNLSIGSRQVDFGYPEYDQTVYAEISEEPDKWNVEMCYGFNAAVTDIEAGTRDKAVEKARMAAEKEIEVFLQYGKCGMQCSGI